GIVERLRRPRHPGLRGRNLDGSGPVPVHQVTGVPHQDRATAVPLEGIPVLALLAPDAQVRGDDVELSVARPDDVRVPATSGADRRREHRSPTVQAMPAEWVVAVAQREVYLLGVADGVLDEVHQEIAMWGCHAPIMAYNDKCV